MVESHKLEMFGYVIISTDTLAESVAYIFTITDIIGTLTVQDLLIYTTDIMYIDHGIIII